IAEDGGPPTSFFASPLFPIFIVVLVDVFGFTMIIPLLPAYAKMFNASDLTIGCIYASYAVCQFIAGPILGRISDRVGRRPTLIFSQVGSLIGFLVLGVANMLWLLFLSRIIDGLTAGNLSIAQAYISDVTKPQDRTKAFGLIGIAFGAGFLIGPAVSGLLSRFGYHVPALVAAGLSLCSILCSIFLLPKVPRSTKPPVTIGRLEQFSSFFKRPAPRTRLLEFFFFTLSFSMIVGGGLALFFFHVFQWGPEKTGYVFACSGLVGGLVQGGMIGRLVKKFGEEKLATIGFLTMAIGYAMLGFASNIPLLAVVILLTSFGSSVTRPSLTTLITKSVGPDEQGAVLGVSQTMASMAQIIGPIAAGLLIQHQLFTIYGITAGVIALAGASFGLQRNSLNPV
ncbi:MAG: MFS transporter, partial [Candidatus Kapaibacterium sp.]